MIRDHPLYILAAFLFAACLQWLLLRKLRRHLPAESTTEKYPHHRDDQR